MLPLLWIAKTHFGYTMHMKMHPHQNRKGNLFPHFSKNISIISSVRWDNCKSPNKILTFLKSYLWAITKEQWCVISVEHSFYQGLITNCCSVSEPWFKWTLKWILAKSSFKTFEAMFNHLSNYFRDWLHRRRCRASYNAISWLEKDELWYLKKRDLLFATLLKTANAFLKKY